MSAWLRLAISLAVVMAVGVVAWLGYSRLRTLDRYQVDTTVWEAHLSDTWVDRDLGASLVASFPDLGQRSIFDDKLLVDLANALSQQPWVKSVAQVRRVFPSQVVISFEMRTPGALVRQNEKLYLIDRDGTRLPGEFEISAAVELELPVFAGLDDVELPVPGRHWRTDGIQMAYAVWDQLAAAGVPESVTIHEIDVAVAPRYGERLVTIVAGGHRTRVLWGKSPLKPDPADASSEEKLANFEELLRFSPDLGRLVQASIAGRIPSFTETPVARTGGPGQR